MVDFGTSWSILGRRGRFWDVVVDYRRIAVDPLEGNVFMENKEYNSVSILEKEKAIFMFKTKVLSIEPLQNLVTKTEFIKKESVRAG